MAASVITRAALVDNVTLWSAATVNSSVYDAIDSMFGGAGSYTTFEFGGAVKVTGALTPVTNNTPALGSSSLMWADLFLGNGAVVNFNNGDVTITHSTNTLTFAGASSGYVFNDGNVGIGTTPSARLDVNSGATTISAVLSSTATTAYSPTTSASVLNARLQLSGGNATSAYTAIRFSHGGSFEALFGAVQNSAGTADFIWQGYNGSAYVERMRLDSSGNVGIGVTPSAWGSGSRGLDIGSGSDISAVNAPSDFLALVANAYFDGSNWKYNKSTTASRYIQNAGLHLFYSAPSGTAGNTITWTERMRLGLSGDLAIGATAKFFLDGVAGTGDTYIHEVSANNMAFYTGGTLALQLDNGQNVIMKSAGKLYLDGGVDTYLEEYSSNEVRLTIGGSAHSAWNATGQFVYYNPPTTASAANAYIAQSDYIRRSTSSLRYKHDIAPLNTADALTAVMAMRPITYRGKTDEDQRRFVGFIAEEVQEIAPLLCTYDEGGESGTPDYVTYDRVTAYLVAVVQQQQQQIAALEARIH